MIGNGWNKPGTEPGKVGDYNATVFDPSVANRNNATPDKGGFRTIYVRFWNGVTWSQPFPHSSPDRYKATMREKPTTLSGEHLRIWWRHTRHLSV